MKDLLKKFENAKPQIVFEWSDTESDAEGWVVINSLRGGAAGGGTRMRRGLDRREVVSLAKTMEIKFTISGPQIGGAKSGINFDPNHPEKEAVLKRWFRAVYPILKNYYGTGGDLNVDEINEVIPITEDFGLWHPQEGIVNGHYDPPKPRKIHMIGRLRLGVSKVMEDPEYTPTTYKDLPIKNKYTIADMITGFGVAESVRHFYSLWGGDVVGKTAIIQGWGNVGATAALYLARYGVKILGIIDKNGGIISEKGLELTDVKKLFLERDKNHLVTKDLITFTNCNDRIWDLGANIFIPAAASRLVSKDQADRMIRNNLEVVACGANVPFMDQEIFYGPISEHVDQHVALISDFIANCGMARTFAYLMDPENDEKITDAEIFSDISETIKRALLTTFKINPTGKYLAKSALQISLEQLI